MRFHEKLQGEVDGGAHAFAIRRYVARDREQEVRRGDDAEVTRQHGHALAGRVEQVALGDEAAGAHPLQYEAPARFERGAMPVRIQPNGVVRKRRKECGLRQIEFVGVRPKVGTRGGLDAVQVRAHRRAIRIRLEDRVLAHPEFKPVRKQDFAQLPER